jgi:general secretion pathway protein L
MLSERILGIDIDENYLKAVVVVRGMRGWYRVDEALLIELSEAGGPAGAIERLRGKVDFRRFRINFSLPAKHISFHNVKLPFHDDKKIKQTIAYELETMLPRNVEEYVFDYYVIDWGKHAEIFAAVVLRSILKERLSLFGKNPPDIGIASVDAIPVASRLLESGAFTFPWLLLDVRAKDIVAVFARQGKIVQIRYFASLLQDLGGFCRKLGNTIDFMKYIGIMEDGPERILLTGEGVYDPSVGEELTRHFLLPVEKVDLAVISGVILPDKLKKDWKPYSMNQALALALLEDEKGQGFNFPLRDPDADVPSDRYGRVFKRGAAVACFMMLLAAVDAYTGYRYARIRLENLKNQINTAFKSAAPEVLRIVDPTQQFKAKIEEMKKIPIKWGDATITVLDILRDVSISAPPATGFMITGLDLDDDLLTIKGTAKDFDSLNILKREFSGSKNFKTVEIGAISPSKQGGKIEFDLKIRTQR